MLTFPLQRGLNRTLFDTICAATVAGPTDSFGMLAMIFGDGKDASHASGDVTTWNRHEPGTARYAAFVMGYGCGVALWEAGEG